MLSTLMNRAVETERICPGGDRGSIEAGPAGLRRAASRRREEARRPRD